MPGSPVFTISWSLLSFLFIESVNHLILCHPLLLLTSIFPSIGVFSNESTLCIRWPRYWGFSFSISPSNEYSGLIYLRIDWFDFLVVQGTLKSLLLLSSTSYLYTVEINSLSVVSFAITFSHSKGCFMAFTVSFVCKSFQV